MSGAPTRTRRAVRRRLRRRDEAGYVAVITALLAGTVFMGLAALGVDVSRWYMELERVQNAADAAALAGVTYMPTDFAAATTKAIAVSARNGYPNSPATGTTVTVSKTPTRPSQLRVTVTSTVTNAFAGTFGYKQTTLQRTALAEYSGPAPIGSPCNVFGNEPPSQPVASGQNGTPPGQPVGSVLPSSNNFRNCSSSPQYWSAVQGPATDKTQGDRFQTGVCGRDTNATNPAKATYGCNTSSKTNNEFRNEGYYFVVHVEAAAAGRSIEVQAYDPAYINTNASCGDISGGATNNMNPFTTTDGVNRYANSASIYCTGDRPPGSAPSGATPTTTSFVVLGPNDTRDPGNSTPVSSSCVKQFKGLSSPPTMAELTSTNGSYDAAKARVFHQWVPLCRFTPSSGGDYYIQVRTDVAFGGTADTPGSAMVSTGNAAAYGTQATDSTGHGTNSFSLRLAIQDGYQKLVSISGYKDMPIRMNSANSSASFYLIRVLDGTAQTRFMDYSFYDAADNASAGPNSYVQVIPPYDASSSSAGWSANSDKTVSGCTTGYNDTPSSAYTSTSGDVCKVLVSADKTDGQLVNVRVPIPPDYKCDSTTLGGCWFTVKISLGGSTVSDFETWDADINGDPVRLVE